MVGVWARVFPQETSLLERAEVEPNRAAAVFCQGNVDPKGFSMKNRRRFYSLMIFVASITLFVDKPLEGG